MEKKDMKGGVFNECLLMNIFPIGCPHGQMCGHPLWMVSSDINMVKSGGVVEMYMTKNFRDSNSVETVKHVTLTFINQPLNVLFQGYFSKIFENSS